MLVEFFGWLGLVVLMFFQGRSLKKLKLIWGFSFQSTPWECPEKWDSFDGPFFPKRLNETTPDCLFRFTRPSSFGIKLSRSPCGRKHG